MSSRQHLLRRATPDLFLLLGGKPPRKTELSWMDFDVYELLERCKSRFPDLDERHVDIWFCPQDPLACIQYDDSRQGIVIHSVLNRPDVPVEVIKYILLHELIHLIIPPREIEGKMRQHPPEFWEKEHAMTENRLLVWSWIVIALADVYRRDEEQEALIVKRSWKRHAPSTYPSLASLKQFFPTLETIPTEAEGLL
jgi:hypothetical protein